VRLSFTTDNEPHYSEKADASFSSDHKRPIEDHVTVALLSGGADRPYFFGLATSLISTGATLDLIGNEELDFPEFHGRPGVNFLDLGGILRPEVSFAKKFGRVLSYYAKLIRYVVIAKPGIFHILWNYRFQFFDRTLLMLYYKLLGKRIVLTAHNVNAARRDGRDSRLNRLTLRIQYRLCHHIFVHTEKMKLELGEAFGVQPARVTLIPFGINNSVPDTPLTPVQARQKLGIREGEKTILFFGRIAPRKGLEFAVEAFQQICAREEDYRLIIAGKPDKCEQYWAAICETIREDVRTGRILVRAEVIPDEEAEVYFKAADVLVLPYTDIFQSGVLFLGYSFGLPAIVADVGSLKDDVVEGGTGFVFRPRDSVDLARTIEKYFASALFANLNSCRPKIRAYASERHSWDVVSRATMRVYADLLRVT
jgi:glycosyltransferase involved in cell wall biosynthesis